MVLVLYWDPMLADNLNQLSEGDEVRVEKGSLFTIRQVKYGNVLGRVQHRGKLNRMLRKVANKRGVRVIFADSIPYPGFDYDGKYYPRVYMVKGFLWLSLSCAAGIQGFNLLPGIDFTNASFLGGASFMMLFALQNLYFWVRCKNQEQLLKIR